MSTPLDDALLDAALTPHLERIAGYLRGACLAQVSPDHGVLRQSLATFMNAATPAIIDRWLGEIGPALGIPQSDWPRIKADQTAAVARWARHVANPRDVETYRYLSAHTRRGFIARFPASRFLAVQMRFTLKRVPANQQILEYSCLEGERSLQHYTQEDGGKKARVK